MDKLISRAVELVEEELDRANEQYPLFASPHEGYGVILEEVEETENESLSVTKCLDDLWKNIKSDNKVSEYESVLGRMARSAILAACENIQVAAMCRKYIQSLGDKEEK